MFEEARIRGDDPSFVSYGLEGIRRFKAS